MSPATLWELAGWVCAAGALAALGVLRWRIGARLSLVAEASHELRGPLTAVRLGLAALARDADPGRARRAAALELELRRAGLALEDLAAAPGGHRAPDRDGVVDVGDLLEEAGDAWAPVAEAFGTRLEVEPPAEWWAVRGDRLRLAQAIGNLLSNAFEHGAGPVRLRARAVGGRLCVEVADAGPGPCAPVKAGRRNAERRGHGLSVAGRVARQGGGRLSSRRTAGGHVMAIELPLLGEPEPARPGRRWVMPRRELA